MSAPSLFDGMLEQEKRSPGFAGAFMLFLSSGGRLQEYAVEYNAPLYNQLENSKGLVISAFLAFQN